MTELAILVCAILSILTWLTFANDLFELPLVFSFRHPMHATVLTW